VPSAPLPENISIDDDRDIPLRILDALTPAETIGESTPSSGDEKQENKDLDPKLAQYLHADRVYQSMIHVEDHEKIRLRVAVRYMLLMFAIFLVFAWIVSNRVIMFGFSEFVWLARVRDMLFAIMA